MVGDAITARRKREVELPKLIFSSNGQGISLAATNRGFAAAMATADLVHADGMSVVLASRMLTSMPLPERVAPPAFFHAAAQPEQKAEISFFLLGVRQEENAAAFAPVRQPYPTLKNTAPHHS